MTRKDYVLIAAAIKGVGPDSDTASNIAHTLAAALAQDNPRFDRRRFLVAAGVLPQAQS